MFRKLVSSITVVIALLFGVSVIYSSGSLAKERGNPSDCAKIKDIEEKKECVKSAMEELKEGKKDRDKDDDKDDDKGKHHDGEANFVPDVVGEYVLKVTVSDGIDVDFDQVVVTVPPLNCKVLPRDGLPRRHDCR